jgi:hypothetical protein
MGKQRSPFTTRPIEAPDMFFGRTNEMLEVLKRVKHTQPISTILIGGRKIGKTSFINQLKYQITNGKGDSFVCVPTLIDMQSATNISSTSAFYEKVTNLVKDNLKSRFGIDLNLSVQKEIDSYELFCNNLLNILDQCAKSIGVIRFILLVDEADRLLGKPFTEDLFTQLRHLINTSPLSSFVSLVITGFRELHDYAIMEAEGMGSVLGGDTRWTYLGVLSQEDCRHLIVDLLNEQLDKSLIDTIYEQSGGHPYITQFLMDKIWRPNMGSLTVQEIVEACNQFEKEAKIFPIWQAKFSRLDSDMYDLLASKPGYNTLDSIREKTKITVTLGEIRDALDFLIYTGIVEKGDNGFRAVSGLHRKWYLDRYETNLDSVASLKSENNIDSPTNLALIRTVFALTGIAAFVLTFIYLHSLAAAFTSLFFLWLLTTLVFWLKDIKLKDSTNDTNRTVELYGITVQSIFDPVISANQEHKVIVQVSQSMFDPLEVIVSLYPLSANLGIKGEHRYIFHTPGESKEFFIYLVRKSTILTLLFPFTEQLQVRFDVITGKMLKSGYIKLNSDYNFTLVISTLLSFAGLIVWILDIGTKIKDLLAP